PGCRRTIQATQAPAATATPTVMPTAPALGAWESTYGMNGTTSSRKGTHRATDSYRRSRFSKPLSGVRTVTALTLSLRLVPAEEPRRHRRGDHGVRCHYAQVFGPRSQAHPAVPDRVQGGAERREVADLAHHRRHLLGRKVDAGQEHVREE